MNRINLKSIPPYIFKGEKVSSQYMNRATKVRVYPNQEQEGMLNKTFGCCRFLYNKMLEERNKVYNELKEATEALYTYKYKTEKHYKHEYGFLKEVDSKALQTEFH